MAIEIESLLGEISPDLPCGEDLSYDPAYMELERICEAQTGGAGMVDGGDQAEDINWRDVRQRCLDLMDRTKHLRVSMYLIVALIECDGFPGLRDGLAVLQGLLERFWDHFYPQLDPDDNYDPLERMNIIASLSPPPGSYQDSMQFAHRVREAPICESRRMGSYSFRDILVATGEIQVEVGEGEQAPSDMGVIEAAFEDMDTDSLQNFTQSVNESVEMVQKIEDFLTEKVGAAQAPNLESFRSLLRDIGKQLQNYLAKRGYGAGAAEGGEAGEEGEVSTGEDGEGAPDKSISGEIRSTQDVLLALEKICQYYERHEPSSPVPLLVRRAQRLVSRNFLDIIRDFAPDALAQVESIIGLENLPPEE